MNQKISSKNKLYLIINVILYNTLQLIFLFPLLILLIFVILFNKRIRYKFYQRIGFIKFPKSAKNSVLIHSSSVGEWNGIKPFIEYLRKKRIKMTFSLNTDTGLSNAKKNNPEIFSFLLPLDFLIPQILLFLQLKPKKIIITETELWPNFIFLSYFFNIPIYLINGRISDKKYPYYKKLSFFYKSLFLCFNKILCQDEKSFKRIKKICSCNNIFLTGSTKLENVPKKKITENQILKLKKQLGIKNEIVIIGGSIRNDEYKILIETFLRLKKEIKNIKFILAPRHINNTEKYINYLKEKKYENFTLITNQIISKKNDIILVNKMGILSKLYYITDICFVGGTIAPIGGHNPIEPAVAGNVILYGKHTSNNSEAFNLLEKNNAAIMVNKNNLYKNLKHLLKNKKLINKIKKNAINTFKKNKEISKRLYDEIFK